jgi:hypothetical protein
LMRGEAAGSTPFLDETEVSTTAIAASVPNRSTHWSATADESIRY